MTENNQPARVDVPADGARPEVSRSRVFSFPEKGSTILRQWNEQRALERAVAGRDRRIWAQSKRFAGAAVDRLTASLAQWSGSISSSLDGSLIILRSRARALAVDNEFARRFLSLVASNVIGPYGPTLQVRARNQDGTLDKPANAAVEEHWRRWGKNADIGGRMSLAHLLRVMIKAVARDGEALIKVVRNRRLPYGIALQLLEADRLGEEMNKTLPDGARIRQGVELDSQNRAVAYWIKNQHPGENYGNGPVQWERVPAGDIFHIFVQERGEQVRGYTWLHAVLMRLSMLHGYEEAAVIAARIGASKMGFYTKNANAPQDLAQLSDGEDGAGEFLTDVSPGALSVLPEGYDFKNFDPDYPHANFESFVKACLRGVASGLDVATHNVSGDMTDVNYSSARIAEMSEREMWTVLQEWLIDQFLTPLYQEWLNVALLTSSITFLESGKALPPERYSKFSEVSRFQGRRWAWVDPLKEATAARELIAGRLTSRTRIAASQGIEWEDLLDELAEEEKAIAAAGLPGENPAQKPLADPVKPVEQP